MTITVHLGAGNVTVNGDGAASNTMTGLKPANTANGDLLIAYIYNRNPDAQTAPGGWTGFTPVWTTIAGLRAYHHTVTDAGSEPASWNWTKIGTGAKWLTIVGRVTGVGTPVQDSSGANSASTGTTSIVLPSVTTIAANVVLIGIAGTQRGSATAPIFSTPAGMTEIEQHDVNDGATSATLAAWFEARPTAGATGTRTSTITNTAASSVGHMIALKPAPVQGSASAAFSFTGTAAGTPETFGSAAASLTFTGTAAGNPTTHGTAAASLTFTGTAAGRPRVVSTATAALGFTGTAAGTPEVFGQGTAALTFIGSATGFAGTPPVTGIAAGSFVFAGTAAGTPTIVGQGASSLTFTAAALGVDVVVGQGATAFTFTGAAFGDRIIVGQAEAALVFIGTIVVAPAVTRGQMSGRLQPASTTNGRTGPTAATTGRTRAVPTMSGG